MPRGKKTATRETKPEEKIEVNEEEKEVVLPPLEDKLIDEGELITDAAAEELETAEDELEEDLDTFGDTWEE